MKSYPARYIKDLPDLIAFNKRVKAAKLGWQRRGKKYVKQTPLYHGDRDKPERKRGVPNPLAE